MIATVQNAEKCGFFLGLGNFNPKLTYYKYNTTAPMLVEQGLHSLTVGGQHLTEGGLPGAEGQNTPTQTSKKGLGLLGFRSCVGPKPNRPKWWLKVHKQSKGLPISCF